jgi:hypothetical protein
MSRRIRFSVKELDLIADMCAIASAAAWGEGDYQDWNESTGKVYDSLRDKVSELLSRKQSQSKDTK